MVFSLKDLEFLKTQRADEDTKRQLEHFTKNCAPKLRLRVLEGVKRYIDYKENGPLTTCFDLVVGDWIWWYSNLNPCPVLILKIDVLTPSRSGIKITILYPNNQIFESTCYNAYRLIDVATPPV